MSERILKINQLIKAQVGQIILRNIEFPAGLLVTLTRVDTSPDLSWAKIFVAVMPDTGAKRAFEILRQNIYEIQGLLNKKLNMRFVPKIRFVQEIETRRAGRVEELLENIKKAGP